MRPAKSYHRSRKEHFPGIYSQIRCENSGKNICPHSGNIFLISTCVVTCAVSPPTDARCLLVCVAAMLEAACQLLSRLYCLKWMLLCYKWAINYYIYLLSTRSGIYPLHGVPVQSYIVWNPFYCYAASNSAVGDGYGESFVFELWS